MAWRSMTENQTSTRFIQEAWVGGCQVEPDDVGDLADQLGVGGEPERGRPPGLDPRLTPDHRDRSVTDPQVLAQQPGGPVRDPVLLRRRTQRGRDDLGPVHLPRPPRTRLIGQARQPPAGEPAPPY